MPYCGLDAEDAAQIQRLLAEGADANDAWARAWEHLRPVGFAPDSLQSAHARIESFVEAIEAVLQAGANVDAEAEGESAFEPSP